MLGRLPDSVDVHRHAGQGTIFHGTYPLARFARLGPLLQNTAGNVEAELEFGIDDDRVTFVAGWVRGELTVLCQRCFTPLTIPVDARVSVGLAKDDDGARNLPEHYEPFLLSDDRNVALPELIEDELLLALPIVPRHSHECAPTQIATAGIEDVAPQAKRENPFAVLKAVRNGDEPPNKH
jgi:uncharacterized protein